MSLTAAAHQRQRLRRPRLRGHQGSDAARQLQPERLDAAQPRHRRLRLSRSAPTTATSTTTRCGSRRSGRSAGAPSPTRGSSSGGATPRRTSALEARTIRVNDAFTSGGAQVAGGRTHAHVQPRVGSRLRAQHPLGPRRRRARTAAGTARTTPSNYLGTYTFESLDGVRGRAAAAATRGASAIRTSTTSTCRRPPTSRTTSACARA